MFLSLIFNFYFYNKGITQTLPPSAFIPNECLSESLQVGDTILPQGYLPICTDPNLAKYVKINIHFLSPGLIEKFMNDCVGPTTYKYLGLGNFTPYSNGFNTASLDPVGVLDFYYNGFQRAEDLIDRSNEILSNNQDQWRKANDPNVQNPPLPVTYPNIAPDIKMQFILSGVYFHEDPRAIVTNLNSDMNYFHNTYGVNKDTEVNIYLASEFQGGGSGIANNLGGNSKYNMINAYYTYTQPTCRDWSLSYTAALIIHETGHNLSLRHTWGGDDDCDDTPLGYLYDKLVNGNCFYNQRANCWAYGSNSQICPGSLYGYDCDTWYKISNNIMDYNQYQSALTSCQIGRIHSDLAGVGNKYVYSCNGCAPANAFFHMQDQFVCPSLSVGGSVYFNGEASYNENRWVLEICEVASLSSETCIGNYYTTGIMTGQVEKFNLTDIYNFPTSTNTRYYKIKLTTGNSECLPEDVHSKIITVRGCLQSEIDPGQYLFVRVTNPVSDYLNILYTVKEAANISIRLINIYSGNIITLEATTSKSIGDYYINYPTSTIPSGAYSLQFIYNGIPYNQQLVVL